MNQEQQSMDQEQQQTGQDKTKVGEEMQQDQQQMEQDQEMGQDQQQMEQDQGMGQQQQTTMTAEQILDNKVVDPNGEEIGEVEKLLINQQNGQVEAVAVALGGFLGMGESYRLLPMQQIQSITEDKVEVNITKEEINNSPTVDNVDTLDNEWLTQTYEYYGVEAPAAEGDWGWQ
jgi:sporulation protein YlmC with PRC-barrel domain